jgi:small subunit ribosomal protein S1
MADTPNTPETTDEDVQNLTDAEAAVEAAEESTAAAEGGEDGGDNGLPNGGEDDGGDNGPPNGGEKTAETDEEPTAETTEEPAAEAPEEIAAETADEPVVEATEEPVAETAAEPAADVAAEPAAEVAAEPAAEVVAEPVAEKRAPAQGQIGYTGKNLGRTITLEELEQSTARNTSGDGFASDAEMITMYEGSMSDVESDQIVTGTVVAITDKEVVVDIGFKSDGVVTKNEFSEAPEVGDVIDVYVDRLEDRRGQLTLSRTKAIDKRRWMIVEEAMETGAVIEGEIVKRIKGGMIVNLLGAEAFLPGSQVDVRPVRDFDVYLNKTMEFRVVKTNPANGNIVISHKALIEKDLQAQRTNILDSLEVGQVLEGQVKNIVNFGVFVDLGGVDGLLHITDLSWGRVGHPSEVVELDQMLNVVVLDYDRERQRISLGFKQLQKHPWDDLAERITEGTELEGRVVSITDYGAFVEIERGIEGLVHISEMSWTEHVKHPTQKVQLGQSVQVKVLKIDPSDKKISLGMKQLEPDPWEGLLQRFPVGTVTRGKVRNITTFGAFVEIEPGIDGLVHVSDLSWTKRVKHPSEVVKKGQELDVVVVDIDVAQRRISLGHKQVSTDPWQQYVDAYTEGTDTDGTVTDMNDGGLVVDLPLGAEAFVPASHLARPGRPTEAYQIGDTLELRVIRTDREDREIVCSETAKQRASEQADRFAERQEKTRKHQEDRREVEAYTRQATGPATLGELSGLAALRDQLADAEAAPAAEAPAADAPTADAVPAEAPVAEAAPAEEPASEPEAVVPDAVAEADADPSADAPAEEEEQA